MSPDEVKNARAQLGMSQARLATVLGLSERNGRNTVRRWENPESEVDQISGPAALCLRYMLAYGVLSPTEQVMDRFGTLPPEKR